MNDQLFGFAVLALVAVFSFCWGGRAERLGAALIVSAWCLTPFTQDLSSWTAPQLGMFSIDLVTFVLLVVLAIRSKRIWPTCAGGFQLVAVLVHVLFWLAPGKLYRAFYYVNFSIGYLLLGALVGGCLVENGAWSTLVRRRSS